MISWKKIRPYVRNIYRIITAFNGFMYDFKRFMKYSAFRENMNDKEQRNYKSVIVYHGLEKSMSYKNRNQTSGWSNAYESLELLKIAYKTNSFGYHDIASKQVLEKFIQLPDNLNTQNGINIKNELKAIKVNSNDSHGVLQYSTNDYKQGILENPESFFNSRVSLREFKNKIVEENNILRAIKLSMKTPSVCNRQAWHIYHTSDEKIKEKVLKYQSGNKPFGKNIPNILVITTDLNAFFAAEEHYQHWIDGGLLSMSLMYALHSLGIASCALNWSQSPSVDLKLRKAVNIKSNHTITMILAVGYPDENNTVCASRRRPNDEIFTNLEIRV